MSELKDLAGEHDFKFVPNVAVRHPIDSDASGVMFGLGDTVYLIFEDTGDGYRSEAGPLLSFQGAPYELGGSWHPEYLRGLRVVCSHETTGKYSGKADILVIRAIGSGKELMRVGTSNIDDYYPSWEFEWHPENLPVLL